MTDLLLANPLPDTAPAWLQERRANGRRLWQAASLPTRKTEAWKYTSLQGLERDFTAPAPNTETPAELGVDLPTLGGSRLVFVDGFWREDLSTVDLPAGAQLLRFADADGEQQAQIRAQLGSAVDSGNHLFANLNDALLADGVFLQVSANTVVDKPVQLAWLTSGANTSFTVNQRLLVAMGANSQATVVEHFAGASGGRAFTNSITELVLEDGARLDHCRLQLETGAALHIGGVHARLGRDSTLEGFHLALGSELKRIDLVVNHAGPGAHCKLNGIYLLRGEEHVDYHTCIEHAAPHCSSDEVFRGVVGDSANAVFNGRIHIHPDAQKTRAELSNKNLLTSNQAQVNTKPELEIYADDVQCAHGATVAQLDAAMLHYLRARGVSRDEAEVMLSYGFINELVEEIACTGLQDYLKPLLAQRFSRDPSLTRHLA